MVTMGFVADLTTAASLTNQRRAVKAARQIAEQQRKQTAGSSRDRQALEQARAALQDIAAGQDRSSAFRAQAALRQVSQTLAS
jgi:hypothetical protein